MRNGNNVRKYGSKPYKVAVVHGGPGATGDMAPVAKELAKYCGVLEPLQTAESVIGQVEELKSILDNHADLPVVLIGHSWGAWLCFMLAAQCPGHVKKLILVSSGPFEAKYAANIMEMRVARLSQEKNDQLEMVFKLFRDPTILNSKLTKFKKFMVEIDSYFPQFYKENGEEFHAEIFRKVWPEANQLRESGELLNLAQGINCPVVAIHGDYDPHPYDGVKLPLSRELKKFRFILLDKCGHTPWVEKEARDRFYKFLREELE